MSLKQLLNKKFLSFKETASLQEAKELKAGKEAIREINLYYDSEIHKSKRIVQKALELTTKKFYKQDIENFEQYIERKRRVEKNAKKADKYLADEAEKERQARLSKAAAAAQAFGAILSGVADNIDAAYQKELDIEQNRTSQLNNQLRERLANEQLSADERKNIQNQIAKNDEELRKKQDEIEKKRFKANKAAAIAEATVNTFLAATGVLAQTKGGTFERIAGMIAVIGAGLAQVAMISKQQFVFKPVKYWCWFWRWRRRCSISRLQYSGAISKQSNSSRCSRTDSETNKSICSI